MDTKNEQEKQLDKKPKNRAMLSVNPDLHYRLKTLALKLGRSIYELTDEAIESYLKENEGKDNG